MPDRRKTKRGHDRRGAPRHRSALRTLEDLTHDVYRRHVEEKPAEHKGEHHTHHPKHPHS